MSNTTRTHTQIQAEEDHPPSVFETCTPREDVVLDKIPEEQFAASVDSVAHGDPDTVPDVYLNPERFFEKTYPTTGLKQLLTHLARRFTATFHNDGYSGTSGVLRLDTSFGGGKTHNEIAAYHLAESGPRIENLSEYLSDSDIANDYLEAVALGLEVNTAVFVGGEVDAQNARCDYTDTDAPNTNTMWGELAYQLFGSDGYEELKEYDIEQTPPGTKKLRQLFDTHHNPSLIVLDEIATYLEQTASVTDNSTGSTVGESTLAKQTNAFLMSLLSVTENRDDVTVVLSIADTAFEDKAQDVREILLEVTGEFNSISDRVEESITPTEDEEVAAVLRYRLFEEIDDAKRDAAIDAYCDYYESNHSSFPDLEDDGDQSLSDRLREAYPFHPTTINTLTEELDGLPAFHRTRGALKLLSRGISDLWNQYRKEEASVSDRHFIRLFDLHPSNTHVRSTLLRLYDSSGMDFEAPIRADIYADDGTAHATVEDRNWGDYGPLGTQLTTAILWKSLVDSASGRGVEEKQLRYIVSKYGTNIEHYDDAITSLLYENRGVKNNVCFYLYQTSNGVQRYHFKVQPRPIKIVESVDPDEGIVRQNMVEALRDAVGMTGPFNVITQPEGVHAVPDEYDTQHLCVMDFETVSTTQSSPLPAPELISDIYQYHATTAGGQQSLREYRNNVLFLVADKTQIDNSRSTANRVASIKHVQRNYTGDYDLPAQARDELEQMLERNKADLSNEITKAYSNLYYPTQGGLTHHSLTPDGTLHETVIDHLDGTGDLVKQGDGAYGVQWFENRIWDADATSMTTRDLEKAFGKQPKSELLLSPVPLRKTIASIVSNDGYAYWNPGTETGYYTEQASLPDNSRALADADNLSPSVTHQNVEITDTHRVFQSVADLVAEVPVTWETRIECDDCGHTFDAEAAYDAHDCQATTCATCGTVFDDTDAYESHLPCGESDDDDRPEEETVTRTTEVQLSSPAHVQTAIKDLQSDIDPWVTTVEHEENLISDDYDVTITDLWIQVDDADGWKATWFVANKLAGSNHFADVVEMEFSYIATNDDSDPNRFNVEYTGSPDDFATHYKFNMEPKEFSQHGGDRSAKATFHMTPPRDSGPLEYEYPDTLHQLRELLAVSNSFTISLKAIVELSTAHGGDE